MRVFIQIVVMLAIFVVPVAHLFFWVTGSKVLATIVLVLLAYYAAYKTFRV